MRSEFTHRVNVLPLEDLHCTATGEPFDYDAFNSLRVNCERNGPSFPQGHLYCQVLHGECTKLRQGAV